MNPTNTPVRETVMNLFRQWINDETSEQDGSSLRNLEVEICYFSEDDKKQMTLKVPFAEYVDPSVNLGIG
jgi:hypothetical protein